MVVAGYVPHYQKKNRIAVKREKELVHAIRSEMKPTPMNRSSRCVECGSLVATLLCLQPAYADETPSCDSNLTSTVIFLDALGKFDESKLIDGLPESESSYATCSFATNTTPRHYSRLYTVYFSQAEQFFFVKVMNEMIGRSKLYGPFDSDTDE